MKKDKYPDRDTYGDCRIANMDAYALRQMFSDCRDRRIHSVICIHNGVRVLDISTEPFRTDVPQETYSISKSFVSAAVGISIDQNLFSLDDLVVDFFDDTAIRSQPFIKSLKIRHLLTMTVGQIYEDFQKIWSQVDWVKAFFETPITYKPGTQFEYNNFASFILSAIIQRTSGMRLLDFLIKNLFSKIGITDAYWENLGQIADWGASGLYISADAMARFGYLLLRQGMWEGTTLIDPLYIELATSKQTESKTSVPAWTECFHGYGFHFWLNSFSGFRASGMMMQELVIVPRYDLVVVMLGCENSDTIENLDVFPKYLIPACETGYRGGLEKLALEKESFRKSLYWKPKVTYTEKCDGRLYKLEKPISRGKIFNIQTHLTAIGLECKNGEMIILLEDRGIVYRFYCGIDGVYRVNTMEYEVGIDLVNISPALIGEWTSEKTFYFEIRPLSINMWIVYWVHFTGSNELKIETYLDARFSKELPGDDEQLLSVKGYAL